MHSFGRGFLARAGLMTFRGHCDEINRQRCKSVLVNLMAWEASAEGRGGPVKEVTCQRNEVREVIECVGGGKGVKMRAMEEGKDEVKERKGGTRL